MKLRILTLLLATLMLASCAAGSADTPQTSAATTTSSPISTTVPSPTSPMTTTDRPIDTTITPMTTDVPTTSSAPETTPIVPTTSNGDAPTTTDAPATTDDIVVTTPADATETTIKAPETTVPTTSTAPITTTEAPTTTTAKPVTTTKAPTTTTKAPVTTKKPTTTTAPVTTTPPVTTAPHTHSYGPWKTTKDATCTDEGEEARTCDCGKSETRTIDATGHDYGSWKTTKAATETAKGEEARACKVCGKKETREIAKLEHSHSYGAWTLNSDYETESRTCSCGAKETQTHYATEADERLIADRVIYYINQFREEEGNKVATKLPRYTLVAEYRSEQLVTNFAHDIEDTREAYTYCQYGEHRIEEETRLDLETFEVIYTGNILDYYRAPGQEAIGYVVFGSTIDGIAEKIATNCFNSEGHWAYVGAVTDFYKGYNYIAVGVTKEGARSYFTIIVSDTNQYE